VFRLDVPALRERGGDMGPLVRQRIDRNNARFGRRTRYPGPDVMARLVAHRWDGNVRKLYAVVDCATPLAGDAAIKLRHWRLAFPTAEAPTAPPYAEAKRVFEAEYLTKLPRECGGNLPEAARHTCLHRPQLYRLLSRHGLVRRID
jgi:two-component system response regulator GlrR